MMDDKILMKDEDLENVAGGDVYRCRKWKDKDGKLYVTMTLERPSRHLKRPASRTYPWAVFQKYREQSEGKHIFLDVTGEKFK